MSLHEIQTFNGTRSMPVFRPKIFLRSRVIHSLDFFSTSPKSFSQTNQSKYRSQQCIHHWKRKQPSSLARLGKGYSSSGNNSVPLHTTTSKDLLKVTTKTIATGIPSPNYNTTNHFCRRIFSKEYRSSSIASTLASARPRSSHKEEDIPRDR